ncbi:MAG: ParB N-terminal domain-containing protein [archaeon]
MNTGAIKEHTIPDITEHNIKLTNIKDLKPHEQINPKRLLEVKKSIIIEGLKYPIVADKKTNIILDGHHRFNAFKKLNIKNIPVYYVNYLDDKIILDTWSRQKITKEDVINKVESGGLFPEKTTRHMLATQDGPTHISEALPKIDLDITRLTKNRYEPFQ